MDDDGSNYIFTNRHVVNTAERVDLHFQKPDGTVQVFQDCPILYVDDQFDVALVEFPHSQKVFERGLKIESEIQTDGSELWSAGFPGLLGRPGWQFAKGTVTNQTAYVPELADPSLSYVIQHTASIDPGNSGGPLLITDSDSPAGFRVVGINTWGISNRQNTFFSLPSSALLAVLAKAKEARRIKGSAELLNAELVRNCKILAAELASEHPDSAVVSEYVSYEFVGRRGFQSFQEVASLTAGPSGDRGATWDQLFFDYNPFETMRHALFLHFWYEVVSRGERSTLKFSAINFADEMKLIRLRDIRTDFMISGQKMEVVWSFEYGRWRVSEMQLHSLVGGTGVAVKAPQPVAGSDNKASAGGNAATATTNVSAGGAGNSSATATATAEPSTPPGPRRSGLYLRGGYGSGAGSGEFAEADGVETDTVTSSSFEVGFEIPLGQYVALLIGAEYGGKGWKWGGYTESGRIDIEENISTLALPLKIRPGFPVRLSGSTLRFFGQVGLSPSFVVGEDAKGSLDYVDMPIDNGIWFEDLNPFNVAILFGGGAELAFGAREAIAVGLDVLYSSALLKDFDPDDSSLSYSYDTFRAGAFVRFSL